MDTIKKLYTTRYLHKKSTFLIPEYLYPEYQKLRYFHKGTRLLLLFLIRKFYRQKMNLYFYKDIGSNVAYQDKGLNLRKENFYPFENNWIELKLLATAHNMSVCAFFVMLLQLELAGALDPINIKGVPPINPKFILHQSISLSQKPHFRRIFHIRI